MSYNRLQTMRDNIEAIRLAFRLGVAGRTAQSAEEHDILRKYAGFGGLKCILNDADELSDAAKWSKSDIELFALTVELRRLIHDYSHNDREFKDYMDSQKASVLTAFYNGEGTLKLVDGPVLVNNDRVLLESKTFRLTYTASSSEAVKFGVWIEDNFGATPWQQTFEFNSKDSGDDNGGKTPGVITPVNPGTITPIGL